MKAVILAGGLGTRISEETALRPKPMIEIGGRPILWHIMKLYEAFGIDEFIVALGYRGYMIKEFFANYALHRSDVTFDLRNGTMHVHESSTEPWSVTLVDTGDATMTGGRLRRLRTHLAGQADFFMTYGDGLANIDITALLEQHRTSGREATMTVVQPPGRFGSVVLTEDRRVGRFQEKPVGDGGWINGGFFVLTPLVFERIAGDATTFENEPLEGLASDGQLGAYRHPGFWQPLDTLRDKTILETLWASGNAPWKLWP